MLKRVTFRNVWDQYRRILWPNPKDLTQKETKEIFKTSLHNLLFVSGVYTILYFLFFGINYTKYNEYNEKIINQIEQTGSSKFLVLLNTYPGNIIYIFLSILVFSGFMFIFTYILNFILELDVRTISKQFAFVLRSIGSIFSIFPILLIFNTISTISGQIDSFQASLMVVVWSILFLSTFIVSTRTYILDNLYNFEQPKRRAFLVWALSFVFIANFMFGVLFGKSL
ncbi:hypothetical protein P3G55_13085 [Leptospira sp. 96542]|nr:hypothetical protein [Leptospira sp. 96542]